MPKVTAAVEIAVGPVAMPVLALPTHTWRWIAELKVIVQAVAAVMPVTEKTLSVLPVETVPPPHELATGAVVCVNWR